MELGVIGNHIVSILHMKDIKMNKNKLNIFLIILNIAIYSFIIGFFYADFSYILQPNKRIPEPIIEITEPIIEDLDEKFEKEKEIVENIVVNINPDIKNEPIYLDYISNALIMKKIRILF